MPREKCIAQSNSVVFPHLFPVMSETRAITMFLNDVALDITFLATLQPYDPFTLFSLVIKIKIVQNVNSMSGRLVYILY